MELKNKEQLKTEILQSWLKNAWVYPVRGPEDKTYLRLTPGGRLKMRRRIRDLEASLGAKGTDLMKQDEEGTIPAEPDRLELAMMVSAYTSERRFIESQGGALGTAAVTLDEDPAVEATTEEENDSPAG